MPRRRGDVLQSGNLFTSPSHEPHAPQAGNRSWFNNGALLTQGTQVVGDSSGRRHLRVWPLLSLYGPNPHGGLFLEKCNLKRGPTRGSINSRYRESRLPRSLPKRGVDTPPFWNSGIYSCPFPERVHRAQKKLPPFSPSRSTTWGVFHQLCFL